MNLSAILNSKGTNVYSVTPKSTLAQAVETMVAHNCGSLVVLDGDQLAGVISERDILRGIKELGADFGNCLVETKMTSKVITGSPDDSTTQTMALMSQYRIRHLPVLKNGKLAGMISIGDLVKAQTDELAKENHFLMNYIQS